MPKFCSYAIASSIINDMTIGNINNKDSQSKKVPLNDLEWFFKTGLIHLFKFDKLSL